MPENREFNREFAKSRRIQAFSGAGAVDRAAISRGWCEFPVPGRPGTSAEKQGIRSKGHRCKYM
jgi:hypothetical protein